MRIDHWHRARTYWVSSHYREAHSRIGSTSDSPLKSHTRDLNLTRCYFSFEEAAISSPIWIIFISFFFMNMVIRLSHTHQTEYSYAIGPSFRNLFLKRTNYFAKHYYRKFFRVKQDMQILVSRRRPFGTPLPTQPCVIQVTFTEWPNPLPHD